MDAQAALEAIADYLEVSQMNAELELDGEPSTSTLEPVIARFAAALSAS